MGDRLSPLEVPPQTHELWKEIRKLEDKIQDKEGELAALTERKGHEVFTDDWTQEDQDKAVALMAKIEKLGGIPNNDIHLTGAMFPPLVRELHRLQGAIIGFRVREGKLALELGELKHKYLIIRDAAQDGSPGAHMSNLLQSIDSLELTVRELQAQNEALKDQAAILQGTKGLQEKPPLKPQPKKAQCPACDIGALISQHIDNRHVVRCHKCGWVSSNPIKVASVTREMSGWDTGTDDEPEVIQLPATQEDIDESGRNMAKLSVEDLKPLAALGGITEEGAVKALWHQLQDRYGKKDPQKKEPKAKRYLGGLGKILED